MIVDSIICMRHFEPSGVVEGEGMCPIDKGEAQLTSLAAVGQLNPLVRLGVLLQLG